VIRLLLAVATACAVVWAAGGELSSMMPSQDARDAIGRTARVVREGAVELLAARERDAPQPEVVAPLHDAVRGLAPAEEVGEPAEFAPEAALVPEAENPIVASRGWDAPLDAAQAEAVRGRLDRVMSLAAGHAK
jgi:hypothetical protein